MVLLTSVCYYEITTAALHTVVVTLCVCTYLRLKLVLVLVLVLFLNPGLCISITRPFAPGVQSANFVTRQDGDNASSLNRAPRYFG